METFERELAVARISSGTVRCNTNDTTIIVRQPTREQVYIGQELYVEVFRDSELAGLFSEDELFQFLLENDLWDFDRETMLLKLPKEIEEFKLKLFKLTFKSTERKVVRQALAIAKETLNKLIAERGAYTYLSCSGAAYLARSKYLLGCSLYYPSGQPVFTSENFWDEPSDILDQVTMTLAQMRLDEAVFREVARTEPWRTTWVCRKSEGSVFGIAPVDYTEEQRTLVGWSNLYNNIFEHPDCPSDDIVEDDDMLDGWLIDQRRQREAKQTKKNAEDIIGNEKIRNSQEIFLVGDSVKDAAKINELNDEHAQQMLKQRFAYLKKHGKVAEQDMPDTKKKLMMEQVQLSMQSAKGKQ